MCTAVHICGVQIPYVMVTNGFALRVGGRGPVTVLGPARPWVRIWYKTHCAR